MSAARILCKYQDGDKSKFVVKAGFMEGKVMNAAETNASQSCPTARHAVHVCRRPHQHSVWSGLCNAEPADKQEEPAA